MSTKPNRAGPDIARIGQIVLGLLWLADGALQFQPYMFGKTFVTGVILPASHGQPRIIGGPIVWMADIVDSHLALFNAGAATLQILIGVGLLYRPAVKLSLIVSFVWASCVWFAGEGLGMLFTGTASPLTGAPGPAVLYVVAGLMCWPLRSADRKARRDAAARRLWSIVWLGAALLWLLPANDAAGSTHDAIAAAPSGAGWLSGILASVAHGATGRGTTIAVALAALSACIGISLLYRWHTRVFLGLAIGVSAGYWVVGQGLGGVFTGQATDPGTSPVMILIASMLLAREHARRPTPLGRFVSEARPTAGLKAYP
jgi:hypothetical protein